MSTIPQHDIHTMNKKKKAKLSIKDGQRISKCKAVHNALMKAKTYLLELNLFASVPATTDPFILRLQRLSTKLFIIILIATLYNFLIYASTATITKSIIVSKPNLNQYLKLYEKQGERLICPCNKISINYEIFIKVNYSFHEVCGSIFVSDAWLKFVIDTTMDIDDGIVFIADFQSIGPNIFSALRSLCEMSAYVISDALNQFKSNNYISALVVPKNILISQADKFFDEFISSTTTDFLLSLQLVRELTHANSLQTAQMTNYYQFSFSWESNLIVPVFYANNCNCLVSHQCKMLLPIFIMKGEEMISSLSGLYAGCFVLEALLQSTLECFYQKTCLRVLQWAIQSQSSIHASVLDENKLKHFKPDTEIKLIVDELMVEEWNHNIIYEQYYTTCQPTQCSYTVTSRHDKVYIITTLFSLIGGLITALKFCIPRLVLLVGKLYRHRTTTHLPSELMIRQRLHSIQYKLTHYILNLNLFSSKLPSTDLLKLRKQRISTRVYLFLLSVSLCVLLFYTSLVPVVKTMRIHFPNQTEYELLYTQHRQSLTCPCTKISTSYQTLVEIDYYFHPICNSIFLEDAWNQIFQQRRNNVTIYTDDFRQAGLTMFQTLKKFCDLINQSISDSLSRFYANNYVSAVVVPFNTFKSQLDSDIDQFISLTVGRFLYSLRLIRDNHQVNALLSALFTNYRTAFNSSSNQTIVEIRYLDDGCSCSDSSQCKSRLGFYWNNAWSPTWYVPGMYVGCYLFEGLLQSTLECFYNQTCVDLIKTYTKYHLLLNDIALDPYQSKRFSPNTTLSTIISDLMVEEWNKNIMYEEFFASCQPAHCSYTISVSNDVITIVTTLIGLIGGLDTVLKLCIPIFISIIFKYFRRRRTPVGLLNINLHDRLRTQVERVSTYLAHLNLFPSTVPTNNPRDLRIQRISTRVYIILLIFSLYILIIYTSGIPIMRTVTVISPDLTEYRQLYEKHSQKLICPCTQINTNYHTFIRVNYTFHQVCHSMYVNQLWIIYLLGSRPETVWEDDFRWIAPKMFQALQDLCELMNKTISDSLSQFYSIEYVNTLLVPNRQLELESITFVEQFITSTRNRFVLLMRIVRDTNHANNIISALWTNYKFEYRSVGGRTLTHERFYDDNCGCKTSSICKSAAKIYTNNSYSSATWIVPGFYMGCFILEALRHSKLECFYNEMCLAELQYNLKSRFTMNLSPLNSSDASRFDPETSIGDILDQLMVETWLSKVIYDHYFASCRPSECFYTISTRNDIIYVITTLIGLLGGLMKTLEFLVPKTIHLISKCVYRRRQNAVQPISHEEKRLSTIDQLRKNLNDVEELVE